MNYYPLIYLLGNATLLFFKMSLIYKYKLKSKGTLILISNILLYAIYKSNQLQLTNNHLLFAGKYNYYNK